MWYKLDKNRNPIPCVPGEYPTRDTTNESEWRVGNDMIGDIQVSTVFLSLDHRSVMDVGEPIVFETMIFGGEHDEYQERYRTWDEAEEGHKRALLKVRAALEPKP